MNFLISVFIPSLLGLKIIYILLNKDVKRVDLVFYYLMLLLFTNIISILFSHLFFGLNSNLEVSLMASPIFSVKYVVVSVIVSVGLGIIFSTIRKSVSISLDLYKNEKK